MQRGVRQSSFSREKTQVMSRNEEKLVVKGKINSSGSGEQQVAKEAAKEGEGEGYGGAYHLTKGRFEKNKLRYSDNSGVKMREGPQLSPYRQQDYEAYNFAHLNPLQYKKKGRSYFYRREQKEHTEEQVRIGSPNGLVKPSTVVMQTQPKEGAELPVEQMHYEMVKTYQKCKSTYHF